MTEAKFKAPYFGIPAEKDSDEYLVKPGEPTSKFGRQRLGMRPQPEPVPYTPSKEDVEQDKSLSEQILCDIGTVIDRLVNDVRRSPDGLHLEVRGLVAASIASVPVPGILPRHRWQARISVNYHENFAEHPEDWQKVLRDLKTQAVEDFQSTRLKW